jgi:[ribosomal protein S5]-alanine N-acetyltransferase
MIPSFVTVRLLLRPLRIEDAQDAQRLFPVWQVVRYLANRVPWPYPEDGALTHYRDVTIPAMERGEQWHWSLRLKSDPARLIGVISLMKGQAENRGFWIGVPWQGQGLMSEAVEPVTTFWFDDLKMPVLRVPKAIVNTASRKISENAGMRVVAQEERDYVCGRLPSEIWEITAEEWRARRR